MADTLKKKYAMVGGPLWTKLECFYPVYDAQYLFLRKSDIA